MKEQSVECKMKEIIFRGIGEEGKGRGGGEAEE